MSDVFRQGLELSAVGFAVVFGVLSVMAIVVSLLKRLDGRWQAAEAADKAAALEREPTIDDTTLAIISAAVFVALQGRGRVTKVRRLRPTDRKGGAWALQGRLSIQGSHVVPRATDRQNHS